MNRITIGAIDIGSNAIRLLINYVEENGNVRFKKAAFIRVPIRLGEDVFTTRRISEEKKERLATAMKAFSHLLKTFKVMSYRACATSAMREAENGSEIVEYIYKETGIKIEIISGMKEAKTIFEAGDIAGLMGANKSYLYVDVGGGSTEVTIYSDNKRIGSESFPLGTVRMISDAVDKDEMKRFKRWIEDIAAKHKPETIIGSGGNINKVHKLLQKKDREPISYAELKNLYCELKELSYDNRIKNFNLNTYRADVIMPAMKIFLTVGKNAGINEILVPKIGLSDGIIHKLYIENKGVN